MYYFFILQLIIINNCNIIIKINNCNIIKTKKITMTKKITIHNGSIILLLVISFTISVIMYIILLGTYYYTNNLVTYINSNPNCNNCLLNKYYCNNALKYAPIPLALILILNILVSLKLLSINVILSSIIANFNFVLYIWFIYCLYNNIKDIYSRNCPCAEEYKNIVNKLQIVSKVLYFIMLFVIGVMALLLLIALVSFIL